MNYRPRVYPGRLVLFRTNDEGGQWDHEMGWGGLASKGIEVHELPGNHLDMFQTNAVLLAQLVENCLESAIESETAGSKATIGMSQTSTGKFRRYQQE